MNERALTDVNKIKPLPGAWLTVVLLCLVGCLNYLDRIMITTMRDSITAAIPMTDAQFGLLTSAFLWVYGLLSPFAGFLADKFKRSRVIIISLLVWSLITWLTAHARTFNELLITRILMGISEACYLPAALALITDYHKGNTRSLATGIHMGGVMLGSSLGFLGGWIAENYYWNNAFSIFGVFGTAYSVILIFFLSDAKANPAPTLVAVAPLSKVNFSAAISDLFRKKAFLLLLLMWSLLGIIGWLILGWLPTYYKERFQLTQSLAGLYATGYLHPMSLLGSLLGGYLADRWSRKYPAGRILVAATGLAIAAPAIFIASSVPILYVVIGGFMIYAVTRIFADVNMMPMLCMIADNRYLATGYGVLNMFACIVGGAGIYAGGLLRDAKFSMNILFHMAAVLLILCVGILLIIRSMVLRSGQPDNTITPHSA